MTPEAIRIAVAEACGYTVREFEAVKERYAGLYKDGERVADVYAKNKDLLLSNFTPSYHEELSDCAEMERTLTLQERWRYVYALLHGANCDPSDEWAFNADEAWFIATATALQRCTAFLKVRGLWQESTGALAEEPSR